MKTSTVRACSLAFFVAFAMISLILGQREILSIPVHIGAVHLSAGFMLRIGLLSGAIVIALSHFRAMDDPRWMPVFYALFGSALFLGSAQSLFAPGGLLGQVPSPDAWTDPLLAVVAVAFVLIGMFARTVR